MTTRENIASLIEYSGGKVIADRYVIEPGVLLISKTTNVIPQKISNLFNLTDDNKQLAELNARITYMNFKSPRENYIEDIVNSIKHHSVLTNITLGFLVTGIKGETLLEFTSSIANISRQTTSRTRTADDTLYVANEEDIPFVEEYMSLRKAYLEKHSLSKDKDGIEKRNEFNLFTKAMSFTISMTLADWIYYVDKKIIEDYEYELKSICMKIKELIKKEYPYIEFASDKVKLNEKIKINK
ncbi:MAG: hypothetical protein HFE81_06730 [Bacilli bacterium]|nr:hypothetical protein [Bacilli bacterium]